MSIHVTLLPAFEDNYLFLLEGPSKEVAIVDPGDPKVVLDALRERTLDAIFITHHHQDHIGGVKELKEKFGCKVFGPKYDLQRIPFITHPLEDLERFSWSGVSCEVLFTPGHTKGHICYHFSKEKIIFVGDTLFAMGCGRLFEGTPSQMFKSISKIANLPDETKIYCAHEYTETNALFTKSIIGKRNQKILNRIEEVRKCRQEHIPTIPTTVGLEKSTNLFVKAKNPSEFAQLRKLKDQFSVS